MTRKSFFQRILKCVAIAACLTVTSMMFSACDKDPEPNDDTNGNGNETKTTLIAGKFASQTGKGEAVFYANYASGASSQASTLRSASAT